MPTDPDFIPRDFHLLKQLARRYQDLDEDASRAISYCLGMRVSLDEHIFRWRTLEPESDPASLPGHEDRQERLLQFNRYRELFALEISGARQLYREAMARDQDWSSLPDYLAESLFLGFQSCALHLAGLFYRLRIPGASDICDAAAYGMVRQVYFRPERAA